MPNTKVVPFTCKSRLCSSCGKKLTDQWIENQKTLLPECPWQHITFTMPSELWRLFRYNRNLLNQLSKLAASTILRFAEKQGVISGIFTVLHTFGRDLKWNVHIHLSVTRGALSPVGQWRPLYFSNAALMPQKENGKIQFRYFDHKTKRYLRFVCSEEEFFKRLLQHIPDKGFRLIRHYSFLANRVRSEYLPTVYNQLNQPERNALAIARNPESKRLLLRVMLATKRITTLKYLVTYNKW